MKPEADTVKKFFAERTSTPIRLNSMILRDNFVFQARNSCARQRIFNALRALFGSTFSQFNPF